MNSESSKTDLVEKINSLTHDIEILKQKNKDLLNQLQHSRDSMIGRWSLNLRTREVYWSEGMYELLNISLDVTPDMKIFYEKLPRECSDQLNGAIQSVFFSKEDYSFEHEIIFEESRLINVRTDLALLLDENSNPSKIEGVTTDITELKSSQEDLERLSLIASKTSNAVVILDTEGTIDWINTGFTIMTGYRIEEVKDAPFSDYLYSGKSKLFDPDYLSKQLSEHHSINEEMRLKTRMKTELWVLINVSPILNYELNPVNYILIMSDITQQRMIEEELRQAEKMASLGKLSAGLAHELNNPAAASERAADELQKVIGELQEVTVEIAKKNIESKYWTSINDWLDQLPAKNESIENLSPLEISDKEEALIDWFENKNIEEGWLMAPIFVQQGTKLEELEKMASYYPADLFGSVLKLFCKSSEVSNITETIEKSTQSISNLINVFKSYSYMDQATVQYVNIHDGIRDTLKILAHKITTDIKIDLDFQEDIPEIKAAGIELNQVWTNLIDNALNAVNSKGIIRIRSSLSNEKLKVEIEDSGTGIAKDIQSKVFDPFFTTKDVGEGTGLGLDVVRRIVVNRIGGEINFDSKPGETIFKVLLPL